MSPPEAHLDTELHDNRPIDALTRDMSDLDIGQKSPVRDSELETYNSFNFWRMPLPQIGDEHDENTPAKQSANVDNSSDNSTTNSPLFQDSSQLSEESKVSENTITDGPGNTSDEPTASSTTEDNTTDQPSDETETPRLEFQDLGISDMDIDDCEESEKNEKDLTCEETVDDSPKGMQPLSGIPTLRFDEDYLQPYSPNMGFDDEHNRVSSPPRSPRQDQVCGTVVVLFKYRL